MKCNYSGPVLLSTDGRSLHPHYSKLACEFCLYDIIWSVILQYPDMVVVVPGGAKSPQVWKAQVSRSVSQAHLPNLQHSQQLAQPALHSTGRVWRGTCHQTCGVLDLLRYQISPLDQSVGRLLLLFLSHRSPGEIYHPASNDCETFLMTRPGVITGSMDVFSKWIIKFLPLWKIPDSDIRTVPCPQKTVKMIVLETMETLKTSHWSWTRPLMDTFFLLRILLTRVSFSTGQSSPPSSPRIIGSNNRASPG